MKAPCAEASMTSDLKPGIGEQSRCAKFFSDFLSLEFFQRQRIRKFFALI
jgi:hypothetical protein